MEKLRLARSFDEHPNVEAASSAAICHFNNERFTFKVIRHALTMGVPHSQAVETVMLFHSVEVEVLLADSPEALARRWTNACATAGAALGAFENEFETEILRSARPKLDDLLSSLEISLDLGLALTLDWIRLFAASCDAKVFAACARMVVARFNAAGFTEASGLEGLPAIRLLERARELDKRTFAKRVIGRFLHELQSGERLSDVYGSALNTYEALPGY